MKLMPPGYLKLPEILARLEVCVSQCTYALQVVRDCCEFALILAAI